MFDSRRKQDWRLFVIFAVLGGLLLTFAGVSMIASAVILPGILMLLMGVALVIGSVIVFRTFFNANLGKKDESIFINYHMQSADGVETLSNIEHLTDKLRTLQIGQEIRITLNPEYFGLVSWTFTKVKSQYISFVTLRKKDKVQEYFIMPRLSPAEAVKEFANVFVNHKAVNTAQLIEMKKYKSVLEYYKLV